MDGLERGLDNLLDLTGGQGIGPLAPGGDVKLVFSANSVLRITGVFWLASATGESQIAGLAGVWSWSTCGG